MAGKKSAPGPTFWRQQIEAAEKRLAAFEVEAQKALGDVIEKGKKTRDDIEELLRESDVAGRAEELKAQLEKSGEDVARRLELLQERALGALGVAARTQVEELRSEVQRLSKKISELSKVGARKATEKRRTAG